MQRLKWMADVIVPPLPEKRPAIMAILNVTPDSFSDGGRFDMIDNALAQARRMIADGADILDIGAESTRPGSKPVSVEEELARLLPVLDALRGDAGVPVSVDTYKAHVAQAATENGAEIINDVWGLQHDLEMARVVAETGVRVVIMHNRFEGADGAINIFDDMARWFETSLGLARQYGVEDDKIIFDPGIGFAKTFKQNLAILGNLDRIRAYGFPVLMGLSRKKFLGKILGNADVDERLFGTLAANFLSIMNGVDMVRVHDVKPHFDMIRTLMAIDAARCSGHRLF